DARPALTFTMRRASTARRSIRRNSCVQASGWAKFDAGLFDVLDFIRPATESFLSKRCLHELIEIPVEHAGRVRRRHAGSKILHHLIGLKHVRAYLVAPTDIGLGSLLRGRLFLAFLHFTFEKLRAQHVPGHRTVAML